MKKTTLFFYSFFSLFLVSSVEAVLFKKEKNQLDNYLKEINHFFVTHHLVEENDKILEQIFFNFRDNNYQFNTRESYINIIVINNEYIIKINNISAEGNELRLDDSLKKLCMKAYLFSQAMLDQNRSDNLWGTATNSQLDIPEPLLNGLLSLKEMTELSTKIAKAHQYRSERQSINQHNLKLDFINENTQGKASQKDKKRTVGIKLASLGFVGAWHSWHKKRDKYPNWNEIIKFRGNWEEYFSHQLPDSKQWIENKGQWLDNQLARVLVREPYDKMTLLESKEFFNKIWKMSAPLWVDLDRPFSEQDLNIINKIKAEISIHELNVNPYYTALVNDFKSLLAQKWFKSVDGEKTELMDNKAQNSLNHLIAVEVEETIDKESAKKSAKKVKEFVFKELAAELIEIYTEFEQKRAQLDLRANLILELMNKAHVKSIFVESNEKKASNQSLKLYKKDPVSDYLNQYN